MLNRARIHGVVLSVLAAAAFGFSTGETFASDGQVGNPGARGIQDVDSIYRLTPAEAKQGRPLRIQGVTTCVLSELHAIVVEDRTGAIYVTDERPNGELPPLGERIEIEGVTSPGIARASVIKRLGSGDMPLPERPSWNQLMNGSLSCRWIEITGVNEGLLNRSNGWSRVELRTGSGLLRVELRRAGVTPPLLQGSLDAVISIRGCMFADFDVATGRVKAGQIRMHDAELTIEQPAVEDLFSLPLKTAAALMRSSPDSGRFQRVRVAGQVVFVRGNDYFVMDGGNGMRFLSVEPPPGLVVGDLVEAVGFPEWGYASPCLRAVLARKTGHAPLPAPKEISSEELVNAWNDATLVRVEGVLTSLRQQAAETVLEIQSGSWRFLARVHATNDEVRSLQLGSKLQLTGVYCAQGGYRALGDDVAPIDLLIGAPGDIRVLARPPWWTLPRVLMIAGILTFLLIAALSWVTQLRHEVSKQTAELAVQIQNRERAEHRRALEEERARIAHDLHDELGADITEVGMLATRARSLGGTVEERDRLLEQAADKTAQMVSTLEEIVWAMDPDHDSLKAVISYFVFYTNRLLDLAGIRLRMETALDGPDRAVDAGVRHQLFLLLKEVLTNVIKHSAATEVRMSIRVDKDHLRLRISDDGRGLPEAAPTAGQNGIANMRTRIEALGGRFEISGRPGAGTEVVLSVPLK